MICSWYGGFDTRQRVAVVAIAEFELPLEVYGPSRPAPSVPMKHFVRSGVARHMGIRLGASARGASFWGVAAQIRTKFGNLDGLVGGIVPELVEQVIQVCPSTLKPPPTHVLAHCKVK